jgi:hypothetical protein
MDYPSTGFTRRGGWAPLSDSFHRASIFSIPIHNIDNFPMVAREGGKKPARAINLQSLAEI